MKVTLEPLAFEWSEVNCFLRPQYLVCEGLAPAHGGLFLFLASQQRAHALRPALPDSLRHGADSQGAFRDLTGVELNVTRPADAADVLSSVKRALDDGPVIVPVAPGHLEHLPAGVGRELHHITLHAYDRDRAAFLALDNVAFHRDPKSVAYERLWIAEAALARALRSTWCASHAGPENDGRWILRIRRGPSFVERSPADVARVMVAQYRRLSPPRGSDRLLPMEEHHLVGLRAATHAGGSLAPLVREYLSDCNFCGVHLRLAAQAIECLGADVGADLQSLVERTLAQARATRTHSLVNCLSAAMTEHDWALLRTRLVDVMGTLQRRLAIAAAVVA